MQRYASLRQGLVGCWCPSVSGPFGYRLPDLSGYGNHGTLTNMDPGTDWVASGGKGALDFDGTNDYVDIGKTDVLKPKFVSVTAWVLRTRTIFNFGGILHGPMNNTDDGTYLLTAVSPDKIRMYVDTTGSSGWAAATTTTTIQNNRWYHVAGTFDGIAVRIYLDGKLEASSSAGSLVYGTTAKTAKFGQYSTNGSWTGPMDDIRIYNRALSESEIRLLASGRGVGLIPERNARRYYQPPQQPRNRSSRFLSFPA